MIDALIAGKLFGKPAARTSKQGRQFVTGKVRVAMRGDESCFIGVVSFKPGPSESLLALDDGDAVSISGELSAMAYIAKDGFPAVGFDLVAFQVLTSYHVSRRREAMRGTDSEAAATQDSCARGQSVDSASPPSPEISDDIPF